MYLLSRSTFFLFSILCLCCSFFVIWHSLNFACPSVMYNIIVSTMIITMLMSFQRKDSQTSPFFKGKFAIPEFRSPISNSWLPRVFDPQSERALFLSDHRSPFLILVFVPLSSFPVLRQVSVPVLTSQFLVFCSPFFSFFFPIFFFLFLAFFVNVIFFLPFFTGETVDES